VGLPFGLFPSAFPHKILYAFLFSPMRATRLVHLILLDLIILICGEEDYKLWSYSLCIFPPAYYYFISLRSKYSPKHPVLKKPSVYVLL
jgi:hypothetical protein